MKEWVSEEEEGQLVDGLRNGADGAVPRMSPKEGLEESARAG
jgi:hypothetical protein